MNTASLDLCRELYELSRYGFPKELTKAGMDAFWERTNELKGQTEKD